MSGTHQNLRTFIAQKIKFSIQDFFSKCGQGTIMQIENALINDHLRVLNVSCFTRILKILHSNYLFTFHIHFFVQCWNGILKNFVKFTGKNLCQSLLFNKIADLFL